MLEFIHPEDLEWWKTTFNQGDRVPEPDEGSPVERPDVTKNQIVAVTLAACTAFSVFIYPLDDQQVFALVGLVATVAGLLLHSDAKIRTARNESLSVQLAGDAEVEVARLHNASE
jgi:hypothetical protein